MSSTSETRTGLLYGLAAYGMWGLLPLYWHLLHSTPAAEVMAHRMVWSLPTAALILLLLRRRWAWLPALLRNPRQFALVAVSATLISVNWYLFIWSVSQERVLEASLGYFINPLVTIAMGVLVLRERLRPLQWGAVGIGALAVVVMALAYGQVPWISLTLAGTFATYSLVKKQTRLDGLEGFSADSLLQFLPALGFLLLLGGRGESTFTAEGLPHALLLAGAGLATALPLILFGAATMRVPLSTVGLLQYLAPTFMFLLGLLAFGEHMPPERWAGFLLVWLALCVLTFDALRTARRNRAVLRDAARRSQAAAASSSTAAAEPVSPSPSEQVHRVHASG
ncbi:EamA family transporter RarD [Streptomyces sp. WMMC1477]|uniref:EamA family transporter RarD n=1 Tax=Streptomyces sp. WMMC1477 TaxID=3015155 RepID=UPI0022B6A8F7|nr:EamA family transporter RarD [Streptomyces sp. WMMC1477]MCZ7432848.1 EamA family transporter RarD [Streptomyces sp. WMMC1477]